MPVDQSCPDGALRRGRKVLPSLVAAWLLLYAAAPLPAQPATTASADDMRYVVHRGDTLPHLAGYLTDPRAIGAVAQRNGLKPNQSLAVGTTLLIPTALLRSVPTLARIEAFRGDVRIEGGVVTEIGRTLSEGTRVLTGANASVSLRLPDRTIVSLPSNSVIRIVRLRRIALGDVYDRRFVLEAGRSQYEVTPNHQDGSRFEIRTPFSVAAVRGTIFRVSLPDAGGANAEVLRGDVAVAGSMSGIDLPAGYGAHSDRTSVGTPVKLLKPPVIVGVSDTQLGPETVQLDTVAGARRYRVQIASDVDFTDILAEVSGDEPSLLLPTTAVGTFYLRATAFDLNGLEGEPDEAIYDHLAAGSHPSDG